LATYTWEELFVEYMEEAIEQDPSEAFPPAMDGDLVVFRGTGDDVIDAWEHAIASGKDPDIASAFDDPDVVKWLTKKKKKTVVKPTEFPEELPEGFSEEFHDDFTKGNT
jgi:hypothetical protein